MRVAITRARPTRVLRMLFSSQRVAGSVRSATGRPVDPACSRLSYQGTLYEHRNDDDGALDGTDEIFADEIRQQHDVPDDLEDKGTADGAPDTAYAAAKRRTANDHGGDRLEFPQNARGRRCRSEPRHIEQYREGDTDALDHI